MSDRIQAIKYTVHDWVPVLVNFGIGPEYLTGKNTACPICGDGKDRFIFSNKFGNGNSHCRQCDPNHQDGIGLIQKYNGFSFQETLNQIEKYLGISRKINTDYQTSKYKKDGQTKIYFNAIQLFSCANGSIKKLTEEEKYRAREAIRYINDYNKIYPLDAEKYGFKGLQLSNNNINIK